jgi:hypothetical protein
MGSDDDKARRQVLQYGFNHIFTARSDIQFNTAGFRIKCSDLNQAVVSLENEFHEPDVSTIDPIILFGCLQRHVPLIRFFLKILTSESCGRGSVVSFFRIQNGLFHIIFGQTASTQKLRVDAL